MLRHRGYMMSLAQGLTVYKHDYAKYVVDRIVEMRFTHLYLYLETAFRFPFDPELGGKRAMTPLEATELSEYAGTAGVEVVPMLNLLGHCGEMLSLEKYCHLREIPEGETPETIHVGQLCPSNPKTLEFAEKAIGSVAEAFPSKIIHVGCDEAARLGTCPACSKIEKSILFADYVNELSSIAAGNGRIVGIWGDMLLANRPMMEDVPGEHAADLLDKKIVIYDWHYSGESPETLRYFSSRGFKVVACSSMKVSTSTAIQTITVESHQRSLFKDCPKANVEAGLITHWQDYAGAVGENFWLAAYTGAKAMLDCAPESLENGLRDFIKSFYGLGCVELEQYFQHFDEGGLIHSISPKLNSDKFRKCLFSTDNPLKFLHEFGGVLNDEKMADWGDAVNELRRLWEAVKRAQGFTTKNNFKFLELPLLTHEHLLKRLEKTRETQSLYKRGCLRKAAEVFESHAEDFDKVRVLYAEAVAAFGNESISLLKMDETVKAIKSLSAFLRYLGNANRSLPAFHLFNSVFFERKHTKYWIAREDEWADVPEEFRRFSVYA